MEFHTRDNVSYSEMTTDVKYQIKFVDYLLQDKYEEHQGNQKIELRFATEFKVFSSLEIMSPNH